MKILGIAGKKQSGKDTTANYLNGVILKKSGGIKDFSMTKKGELSVLTSFADGTEDWGILDLGRRDTDFAIAAEETIWPYVKNYSFANILKKVAVEMFGLKPNSVYGNEVERAAPTHLLWENMPGVLTDRTHLNNIEEYLPLVDVVFHNPGPMSGREFLQFFGTGIGRRMYPPIWINSTINKIMSEQSGLAIITDVRFPDEVEAIKKAGGLVIRLNRDILYDTHESETALDENNFNYSFFNLVVDNQDLTIMETCELVHRFCKTSHLVR